MQVNTSTTTYDSSTTLSKWVNYFLYMQVTITVVAFGAGILKYAIA